MMQKNKFRKRCQGAGKGGSTLCPGPLFPPGQGAAWCLPPLLPQGPLLPQNPSWGVQSALPGSRNCPDPRSAHTRSFFSPDRTVPSSHCHPHLHLSEPRAGKGSPHVPISQEQTEARPPASAQSCLSSWPPNEGPAISASGQPCAQPPPPAHPRTALDGKVKSRTSGCGRAPPLTSWETLGEVLGLSDHGP